MGGKTLRERDILLFESPKLYDSSRRTTLIRDGFFRVLFPVIVLDILLYDHKVVLGQVFSDYVRT